MSPLRVAWVFGCCAWLASISLPVWAGTAEDQFAVAASHYTRQRWQLAADEFQRLLEMEPNRGLADDARFYLAESLVQLGEYDAALTHYERLLEKAPTYRHLQQTRFRVGELAYLLGRHGQAERELARFCESNPHNPLAAFGWTYLGELALRRNDAEQARQAYTRVLEQFPEGPTVAQCRFGLGRALEMDGETEAAERFYKMLAAETDNDFADDAQLQRSLMRYNRGDFAEAAGLLDDFIDRFPHSRLQSAARYWLGRSLAEQSKWGDAAHHFEYAAQNVDREDSLAPSIVFELARSLEHLERPGDAETAFARVYQSWPESRWADDALLAHARLAFESTDLDQLAAISELVDQLAPRRNATQIRQLYGRGLLKANRADEAAGVFQSLIEDVSGGEGKGETASSDAATHRYFLALAHLAAERYQPSLETLDQLDTRGDSGELHSRVLLARATALMNLEQWEPAAAALQRYLQQNPVGESADECRVDLVLALTRSGNLAAAEAAFDEARGKDVDPQLLNGAALLLAEAAYEQEDFERARRLFRQVRGSANPDRAARAVSGYAWCLYRLDQHRQAADTFHELLTTYPEHSLAAEAALMRARTLERTGAKSQAARAYHDAAYGYPAAPQYPDALFAGARLLQRMGRLREAILWGERLIVECPDYQQLDAALYHLAWDLDDAGLPEAADVLFQRLYRLHGESPYWADATYRLAERAARGDREQLALDLLHQLIDSDQDSPIRKHGLFLRGQMASRVHEWSEAEAAMQQLVDEFPNSTLATPARYWLAEALFRQEKLEQAESHLELLAHAAVDGDEDWLVMIPLRQGQILARTGRWTEALEVARQLDQRFGEFPQRYELDYLLGRCWMSQAQMSTARDHFRRVVDSPIGGHTETAAMAQWMIGETYFLQKNYDEALRAYHRVESLFGYRRWQAAALLQAGKCREMKRQAPQAIELYRQVAEQFADTRFANQAVERLQALGERNIP